MASSEIRATLTLDIKDFISNMTQAQSQIANFSQSASGKFSTVADKMSSVGDGFSKTGNQMQTTGKNIIGALTPITGVIVGSVKHFANYDDAVTQLSRTSGLTGKDLDAMKASLADLSNVLGLSEADVANIASSVAAYGVTGVKDISGVTKVASQMQVAFENVSAEDAAASIAKFSNITGLSMNDVDKLGSCIAGLENDSAACASQIMEVNNRIGGMCSSVKMTAPEISAWSTAMISGGMSAELAGSNFTKFQGELSAACSQGGEAVQGFADVAGMSADDFIQLYSTDATAATEAFLKGLNRIEDGGGSVVSVLDDLNLGGTEQLRMMQILMAATDDTSKGYSDLDKYMSVANEEFDKGTALQEEFDEASKSVGFAIQKVVSELKDTSDAIGNALKPAIMDISDRFTEWLGKVQTFVQEHPKVVQGITGIVTAAMAFGGVVLVVGKFVSAIGGIVSGIGTAISAVSSIASAISGLGGVIGLLTNPITLVIAGIAAFAAAFVYCWNNVEGFKEKVTEAFNTVCDIVSGVVSTIWDVIQTVWGAIKPFVTEVFQGCAEIIGEVFTIILDIVVPIVEGIWNTIQAVWSAIKPFVEDLFNGLAEYLGGIWDTIYSVIKGALDIIKAVINGDWGKIKDIVINMVDGIKDGIERTWNAIKDIISTVLDAIKAVISSVWEGIKSAISSVLDAIKSVVSSAWEAIKNVASDAWEAIKNKISDVWEGIKDKISSAAEGVKTKLSDAWENIKNTASNAWESVKSTASSVWKGIKSAIINPIKSAKEKVLDIVDKIKSAFKNMHISIPKPKLPHIKVGSRSVFGGKVSIPTFSIDWYAKGGFFNSANVIGVGEAGREAVLPLENKRNMKPYAQAVASLMNDFTGGNNGTVINNTFNVQATVREESDIDKIAEKLERLQRREERKRGLTPRTNR